jgi:hypothetical protein
MSPDVEALAASATAHDMALRMLAGEPIAPSDAQLVDLIAAFRAMIPLIEKSMWAKAPDIDDSLLESYQVAFRHLEQLISRQADDLRHDFIVVIPVADRPLQLNSCLQSLLHLCNTYAYGGVTRKVSVVIADDSKMHENIAANRIIAARFIEAGLKIDYFGLDEQLELLDTLSDETRLALSGVLGTDGRADFSHKGASIMRNIAYLKLDRMAAKEPKTLFYFIDSDQEFKVKIPGQGGDREIYATNYFYYLDQIFASNRVTMLTGKVVGDPPVSPAVMAGKFLDDVISFLRQIAGELPDKTCSFHDEHGCPGDDASYHDMANLFGFASDSAAFRYRCTLTGAHRNADCFADFSQRLQRFFYGEHPTRSTYYRYEDTLACVRKARTVYTGNYIFKPEALRYFIPFASLRLRMAGPVLGRIIRAEIPDSFLSANLPMLHLRTVRETGHAEFRPGIEAAAEEIDLSGEFERQFYGDVMLFTVIKLTDAGFFSLSIERAPTREQVVEALQATYCQLCERYEQRRLHIAEKLDILKTLLHAPENWWNGNPEQARANFEAFMHNIERNFGAQSHTVEAHQVLRLDEIAAAILSYPQDRAVWQEILSS